VNSPDELDPRPDESAHPPLDDRDIDALLTDFFAAELPETLPPLVLVERATPESWLRHAERIVIALAAGVIVLIAVARSRDLAGLAGLNPKESPAVAKVARDGADASKNIRPPSDPNSMLVGGEGRGDVINWNNNEDDFGYRMKEFPELREVRRVRTDRGEFVVREELIWQTISQFDRELGEQVEVWVPVRIRFSAAPVKASDLSSEPRSP
jgi:hypothetical protein